MIDIDVYFKPNASERAKVRMRVRCHPHDTPTSLLKNVTQKLRSSGFASSLPVDNDDDDDDDDVTTVGLMLGMSIEPFGSTATFEELGLSALEPPKAHEAHLVVIPKKKKQKRSVVNDVMTTTTQPPTSSDIVVSAATNGKDESQQQNHLLSAGTTQERLAVIRLESHHKELSTTCAILEQRVADARRQHVAVLADRKRLHDACVDASAVNEELHARLNSLEAERADMQARVREVGPRVQELEWVQEDIKKTALVLKQTKQRIKELKAI
eukprot:PhM_4_TR388/c4_g2_i1/m.106747